MEVEEIKHKLDSKGTKDKIIELFFEKHLRPVDISKKLKVKMPYITKIIQKDLRYNKEKETRRQRKFDSFNSLNVTKVLQTLYFFVKFLFFSCTMSHNVV